MASTNFQTIALIPLDSDNSNRIATMRNIQNLSTSLTNSFSGYGGRITTLENGFSSYGTRIGTLETNYGTLSSTVTSLQGTVNTNSTNISTLQGQMTTANNNIATLQSKIRYDIGIFSSGTCTASERVFDFTVPVAFSVPANLSGSVVKARTAAVSAFVFTIRKNGTSFGTINFAAGAVTGTVSTSAQSFGVGDQIDILAQSATDALADITITIAGTR